MRPYLRWLGSICFVILMLMLTTVAFSSPNVVEKSDSKTRVYYIAADEVDWNYAPSGMDVTTGRPFDDMANVFVKHGDDRVGSTYIKAVYHEYTDDTFMTIKTRPPEWEHLGLLGPVIRAEVGDTIKVVFKNNARFPHSIHPHGVLYKKDSEGSPYNDNTTGSDKSDDAVPTGGVQTYLWEVPDRAGPGPNDPSSIVWFYHSHTDEVGDTNAGLIGVILVSAAGTLGENGHPIGIDREFVTLFKIMDENKSPYLHDNVMKYTKLTSDGDDAQHMDGLMGDEEFGESNLMHSINGYVFGNLPGLTMKLGDRVRWYVVALGNEVDLHTPHWHGITVLNHSSRTDILNLLPGTMDVVDTLADNPGIWMFHCHVDDHMMAGMQAFFTINP